MEEAGMAKVSEVEKTLLLAASEAIDTAPDVILKSIDLSESGAMAAWKESLDDAVRRCWPALSLESKLVAIIHAVALDRYQRQDD